MEVLVIAVLLVLLFLYPLFLLLSIGVSLRKYLKCKIEETELRISILEQQNKDDYRDVLM